MLDVTTKPVIFDANNGGQLDICLFDKIAERNGYILCNRGQSWLKKIHYLKIKDAKQDKPNIFGKK